MQNKNNNNNNKKYPSKVKQAHFQVVWTNVPFSKEFPNWHFSIKNGCMRFLFVCLYMINKFWLKIFQLVICISNMMHQKNAWNIFGIQHICDILLAFILYVNNNKTRSELVAITLDVSFASWTSHWLWFDTVNVNVFSTVEIWWNHTWLWNKRR